MPPKFARNSPPNRPISATTGGVNVPRAIRRTSRSASSCASMLTPASRYEDFFPTQRVYQAPAYNPDPLAQFLLITTLLSIIGIIATAVPGFAATPAHVASH